MLDPVCRPDGYLDPMRVHAAAGHFYGHPRLMVMRNGLQSAELPDSRPVADALLLMGQLDEAATTYHRLQDMNSVAVYHDLLDQSPQAESCWRNLLTDWSSRALDLLPIRYNLALFLYMQMRLFDATAEFKACRAVYPHYRDTLFFLDWIKICTRPGGPPTDIIADAIAMPVPRYSSLRAYGSP